MADQKIRDRIRRLRELNVGRGCTEAEALAAAEKAAQLMRDHACPSKNGGSAIAAKVNLTGLAIDIERALS